MAALSDTQRRFIISRLAVYDTPSEVAEAVAGEFDLAVSRQQVNYYDASKPTNRKKLAAQWVDLFDDTRRAFLDELKGVAIAHKAVRLRRLERIADTARKMRNHRMEMDALEQAAKEVGDAYTNRRELTGQGGGPLRHAHLSLSDEDLDGATVEELVDTYFAFDQEG